MEQRFNKVVMILLLKLLANNLSWAFQQNNKNHQLFFLQRLPEENNDILLKVTWGENRKVLKGCKIYTKKNLINRVLESSNDFPIQKLPEEEMKNLLEDCKEFDLRKNKSKKDDKTRNMISTSENINISSATDVYSRLSIFFPGTKWCGTGNVAENYDDLGPKVKLDKCCRAHDNCGDCIMPGESKGNLTNTSWFPMLNCECDRDLYYCLLEINSVESQASIDLYFYILNKECYALDYPFTEKCKRYYTFLEIICLEYERDMTAPKVYQRVLSKKYKDIPIPGPITTESY